MQLHMPKHIVGLTLVWDHVFQDFIYRTIWRKELHIFQVELVSPSKDFHKCYAYVLDCSVTKYSD